MRKHSEAQLSTYKCEECDKTFANKATLDNHQAKHTGEKTFSCKHCSRVFSQKITLLVHEKTHNTTKNLQCLVCDRGFDQLSALAAHMNWHNNIQIKPFKCSHCPQSYAIE